MIKQKKTIIFAVTNDLSYDQRMIRICNSLATNGYQVKLIGRTKNDSIPLVPKTFQQHRFNLFFSKGKFFYLEYNFRLFWYLLFNRMNIIGSIDLDTLLPCFLVAKIKGKPLVFDAHEYFTEVPEVINRPMTKKIWETLGNWIIPQLKYAYTVSASLQKLFTKKYNIPFRLIRSIASFKPKKTKNSPLKQSKKIILYQGVLNEGRGLEAMIEAMQQINQTELWLAGEGDLSDKLRKLVADLALEDQVRFLGYLTPEKLKTITLQATIGINLIENRGLSYYYSLANKTFDYMQANVPAIHCNFPEYQRINAELEIGILVDDLKSETLVSAVNQLLNDDIFYKRIVENCEKGKTIFTWEQEALKLIDFYDNIKC